MMKKQNCLIIWIKIVSSYTHTKNYIYAEITEDVETGFDTSTYKLDRPLPKGKSKKLIEKRVTSKLS